MDKRIFVEKKNNFGIKSQSLMKELIYNSKTLSDLRMIIQLDVFHSQKTYTGLKHIFSEQVTDRLLTEEK